MNELHLSFEEREILSELLRHSIEEMDKEVFRTDSHDFKVKLKHRRDVLEHVVNKLEQMPMAV